MPRKPTRRSSSSKAPLVRMEEAAEQEILETPALMFQQKENNVATDEEEDEGDEDADKEAEIERRLVEELEREQQQEGQDQETTKNIYHKQAMEQLIEEWNQSQLLPWVETLDTCQFPLILEDVHDDLKREVAFYNQTLASVKAAKDRLLQEQIPYKRPEDYFAEMLKSDVHMAKVKDKLIYEQKKITAVEERKKSQAHKKVAKELQSEKLKQRAQAKKDTLDAVKQWKKRRGQQDSTTTTADAAGGSSINSSRRRKNDDDNDGFEEMLNKSSAVGGTKRKRDGKDTADQRRMNKKRDSKNKKYGFGGKKKYAKSNTKASTNDFSNFNKARNNAGVGKRATRATRAAKTKAAPSKRPGKTARANQKSRH